MEYEVTVTAKMKLDFDGFEELAKILEKNELFEKLALDGVKMTVTHDE